MGSEDRLEELEIKVAYQENQIEELNKALFDHWKVIEKLTRDMETIVDRVAAVAQQIPASPEEEKPPPHY